RDRPGTRRGRPRRHRGRQGHAGGSCGGDWLLHRPISARSPASARGGIADRPRARGTRMRQVGVAALTAVVGLVAGCGSGVQLNSTRMDPAPKTARIEDLSMAIARSPRDPKFYVERAQAYEAKGQTTRRWPISIRP